MINNKVDEAIFDAVLRQAFTEACETELKEYEKLAEEYAGSSPTKKQRKEAYAAMQRARKATAGISAIVRRIAASVLILFSMASVILLSEPGVRAAIADTVTEFYDKYVSFIFRAEQEEITLGEYTFGYIPDGYLLVDSFESNFHNEYVFQKGDEVFIFSYSFSGFNGINIDTENKIVKSLLINGMNAYYLEYTGSDGTSDLVFGDKNVSFRISGNISEKEFVKIAKNIK